MPDAKPRYANFPERELKVVIGPNINAVTTRSLSRLSIGTYEMSFTQQERAKLTCDAVKSALHTLFRGSDLAITTESSREYPGVFVAQNATVRYRIWVTTPFELTQSAHLVWVKYQELGADAKVGVTFRLSTSFKADEVVPLVKAAQARAVLLEAGQAFEVKGNPPPRFQKKGKAAAQTAPAAAEEVEAPAEAEAPAAGQPPAGQQPQA